MTLRRAMFLAHGALVAVLLAGVAWMLWITAAYVPDPDDDWPVGPGVIAIPMAVVLSVGVIAVAVALWSWRRSGRRATLAIGDLVAAGTVLFAGMIVPPPLAIAALVALVVAGGCVAALGARAPETDGARRSPVAVLALVLAAVAIGLIVGPMLGSFTFWLEP